MLICQEARGEVVDKKELQRIKKSILRCLTEDFTYGRRKDGTPLKRPHKNQAIFNKEDGWSVFNNPTLDMVMDKVVLGLYFALDDTSRSKDE